MQLRDRKYIKNTGNFPKYYGGLDGYSFFGTQRLTAPNTNNLYGGYYMPENPYQTSQFFNKPNPSYNDYLIAKNGGDPNVAGKGLFQYKTPSLAQTREQQQTTPNPTGAIGSAGLGPWGAIAEIAATNVKGAINEFAYDTVDADEILSNQQTSNSSFGGINYKTVDTNIDKEPYMDHWSTKNVLNDVFSGNIGGAIGKLFSGKRKEQERKIARAKDLAALDNAASFNNAYEQYLRNGHAEGGKDAMPITRGGKVSMVSTAYGKRYMPQNSYTNKGEEIVDTLTYDSYKVKNGPRDNAPTFLRGRDAVLTNSKKKELLNPETGNTFAEDWPMYKAAGIPQRLLDLQEFVHLRNSANYKTPRYKDGRTALDNDLKRVDRGRIPEIRPWEILASRLPGLFSSFEGLFRTRKQPTSRINSYRPNTYAGMALPVLANLRVNSNPVLQDIDNKYRTYLSYLNSQPSLTAGQRQLYQLAAMRNSQEAKAKAIYDSQLQNNAYLSNWANTAINVGDKNATNEMNAVQYDKRYMDMATAAKNKVINSFATDIYNQSGALTRDLMNSRILNAMLNRYQA